MASRKRHGEFRCPRRQRVVVVTNPPKQSLLGMAWKGFSLKTDGKYDDAEGYFVSTSKTLLPAR